jgi:hypothetical protein
MDSLEDIERDLPQEVRFLICELLEDLVLEFVLLHS